MTLSPGLIRHPVLAGLVAVAAMLALYFGASVMTTSLPSARAEFAHTWPFVGALAAGFGLQVGLYLHLRAIAQTLRSKAVVAANGGISGTAILLCMVCCNASFANLLPALAAAGVFTLIGFYQQELFAIALAANVVGVGYFVYRLRAALTAEHCA